MLAVMLAACTGGSAGDPSDDVGDIFVMTHSPSNGETLRTETSDDGFNALNTPTLRNPGAVTVVFTNSLDLSSVLDPSDLQGTRNVRLFYFDTSQGPFDPGQPQVPGVNPPGANVLIEATATPTTTNVENDTLIIRPSNVTSQNPLPDGQYSVIVQLGVRGADGDGMTGREYFFFFRVGDDDLGPVIVESSPTPGERFVEPDTEIRITMSETIRASSVNTDTIKVNFQPAGSTLPTQIPGVWYTDGGNGPGNNFPFLQLDQNGNPGFTGVSPRNGIDLVFRPDLDGFPNNMTAEDPQDPFCSLKTDPPRKGNLGFPLGTAINVEFQVIGMGVTDTAGNTVPAGSPNTKFTFETRPFPDPVFAPNTRGAVYYADTVGVGVIDVDPARTPYLVGPNPPRTQNSVVMTSATSTPRIVRVPVPDIVDMTTDTRPYTSFYTLVCGIPRPNIIMGNLYVASRSQRGGEVVVLDTYRMEPLGRFGTPSPGGIALTAVADTGRAVVSNFSANTVTVYDIHDVKWFTGPTLFATTLQLRNAVATGQTQLILSEQDFTRIFPVQRFSESAPPGPPILGTINVGISPSATKITAMPSSMGVQGPPCFSPVGNTNTIIIALNSGENTVAFSEITNLNQSQAIEPDLPDVNVSSQPSDVAWSPFSVTTGSYHFYITAVGGTVELFASGFISNRPSVRPDSASNFAPNKIVNNIGGLKQPSAVQWITSGNATITLNGYTLAVLIAETGANRIQQLAITSQAPSLLFETINSNLAAGLGPIDITGDPEQASGLIPCGPRFQIYYVANAGEGNVRTSSYNGGVIGTTIPIPGVQHITSWWSR